MITKKAFASLKITGFFLIVIGGGAIAFGPTQTIKIIGGLLVTLGAGFASLT